jgi:prevent-host-death family protein
VFGDLLPTAIALLIVMPLKGRPVAGGGDVKRPADHASRCSHSGLFGHGVGVDRRSYRRGIRIPRRPVRPPRDGGGVGVRGHLPALTPSRCRRYDLTMSVFRKRSPPPGTVNATEFKARCLELMDRVAATGNPLVITKRGRPVARLVAVERRPRSIVGALQGHVRITGDIVSPVDVRWEASR